MFQFVPRKVAQKSAKLSNSSSSQNLASNDPAASAARPRTPEKILDTKGKGKANQTQLKDEDIAATLWLSLSDYALWVNVDLRRAVANADEGCTCIHSIAHVRTHRHLGIPLSYLGQQSPYLSHLGDRPSEASLVRAVRAHADSLFEVRMLVTSPSKAWYGKEFSTDDQGGYEIRRKDWSDALIRVRNSTRNEWEARTVYMVSRHSH